MRRLSFVIVAAASACGGKADSPHGATITVDGKSHAIESAVVSGGHVALSTGPMDCATLPAEAQLIVSRGELGWTLGGAQFPRIFTASHDAMATAKLEVDGRTVTLSGGGTIGGHSLTLAGSLVAIVCEA